LLPCKRQHLRRPGAERDANVHLAVPPRDAVRRHRVHADQRDRERRRAKCHEEPNLVPPTGEGGVDELVEPLRGADRDLRIDARNRVPDLAADRARAEQAHDRLEFDAMWILQSAHPDAALTFRLGPGAIKTVGRAPRADFIVDAALVSRLHCRITAGAEKLEVVDLESTNGTYVNGKRIRRAELKIGDSLRVGRVELKVERQA